MIIRGDMKARKTWDKIMLKILYAVHLLCSRCIENLSALHKDDLLPAVTAYRRCAQSIYVFRTKAFYKIFRSES